MLVGYLYLRRDSYLYVCATKSLTGSISATANVFEVYINKHKGDPPSPPIAGQLEIRITAKIGLFQRAALINR